MDRYAAIVWNAADGSETAFADEFTRRLQAASTHWTIVHDAPGLRVASLMQRGRSPAVTLFQDHQGIIIGRLFERGAEAAGEVRRLGPGACGDIEASRGQFLIEHCWGNYLALWRDPLTRDVLVLRDPCGGVPCFVTRVGPIDLLFSNVDDIADLLNVRPSIDWDFVKSFLLFNYFVTPFTGFREISEVLPGQRLIRSPDGKRECSWAWDPVAIARDWKEQDFDAACSELLETATACFTAWGASYQNILVRLSGGLDSSIVVNLLRACTSANVTAMHIIGSEFDTREVEFARLAAAHACVELIECPLDPRATDLRAMQTAARLVRPTKQLLGMPADDLAVRASEQSGADCLMPGHGGDALFVQRAGAGHAFDDYMRLNGLGGRFWKTAYDTTMLLQQPIWRVVGNALRDAVMRPSWLPYPFLGSSEWLKNRFLKEDAITALREEYILHPWIAAAQELPPGKADQLCAIIALRNYHTVRGSGLARDVVLPLAPQPIVEFCLRTPTYQFGCRGLDRSLERTAFAGLIPEPIARRTGKGLVDSHLLQMMSQNLSYLRELVLDGDVVRQDWVDRRRVEAALNPDYLLQGNGADDLYNLVVTEAWLSPWR